MESIGGIPGEKDITSRQIDKSELPVGELSGERSPMRNYRTGDYNPTGGIQAHGGKAGERNLSEIKEYEALFNAVGFGIEKALGPVNPKFLPEEFKVVSAVQMEKEAEPYRSKYAEEVIGEFARQHGFEIDPSYPDADVSTESIDTGRITMKEDVLEETLLNLRSANPGLRMGGRVDVMRKLAHEYIHRVGITKRIVDPDSKKEIAEIALKSTANLIMVPAINEMGLGEEMKAFYLEKMREALVAGNYTVEVQGSYIVVTDENGQPLVTAGYNMNEEVVELITDEVIKYAVEFDAKNVGYPVSPTQVLQLMSNLRQGKSHKAGKSFTTEDHVVTPTAAKNALDSSKLYNLKRIFKTYQAGDLVEALIKYNQVDMIR